MAAGPADALLERARGRTGLDDFGSQHFREMLDLWVGDVTRPQIDAAGSEALLRAAEVNLSLRLRILAMLAEHPEIGRVPLPPIVFISGFARSGTTLLHALLGLHPDARTIRRWELVSPLPPPEAATWATDARIARVQERIDRLRGSGLEQMHWIEADDPEECTHGYYDCSGLLGRGPAAAAPSWSARLLDRDEQPTLEEHRRLLQLLLWRNPPPEGCVLVLKNPTTAAHLPSFAAVFPEARVVLTHRDPYRCATSILRVIDLVSRPFYALGVTFEDAVPGGAHDLVESLSTTAGRMRDFAHRSAEQVRYPDLMADPVGTTAGVLTSVGLPVPPDWEERVRAYVAWQRSGGRATPPASYDVDLRPVDVWQRDEVVAYAETFGVTREIERVTDPAI